MMVDFKEGYNESKVSKCMKRTASDLDYEVPGLTYDMSCSDSQFPFAFTATAGISVLATLGFLIYTYCVE